MPRPLAGPACGITLFIGGKMNRRSTIKRPAVVDPEAMQRTIMEIAGRRFDGMTYVRSRGVWKGDSEPSVILQTVNEVSPRGCARLGKVAKEVARDIARALDQDAVAVLVRAPSGKGSLNFVSRPKVARRARGRVRRAA